MTEGDTIEVRDDAGVLIDTVLRQSGRLREDRLPDVDGAKVEAGIKHTRGPKLIVWKMKRRKGYRNKNGHRQDLSVLKINKISA